MKKKKSAFKVIRRIIGLLFLIYAGLFAVFFFDLDGKLLYHIVEPALCNHYDRMKRKDPLKKKYEILKPNYEYKV